MDKYRKKSIIVEAGQWFQPGDVEDAPVVEWPVKDFALCNKCSLPMSLHGKCEVSEGFYIVCPGDFIVKENGQFFVLGPIDFHRQYERVLQ